MKAWDFDAAYRAYARMVYWTAYGILKSDSDAMDVSQDTFMRAIKHEKKLAAMTDAQQKGWLYRVAYNLCMDKKRREKREFPSETEELFDGPDMDQSTLPEAAALSKEQKRLVRDAIDALPEVYRETVVLHYFSGLPYEEIAALTGASEGTIKSRMSRAKGKLLETLKKGGEIHG
ncbi:MAG: RNA polymerase sigma factor [Clostridia bacterium]|nr:RNA polymerase sigma factor [Clostridia bacterium]